MINSNFVIVGVLLNFFGGLSYVVDTVKGKIKPNRVSWLLWTLAPTIAFIAEVQQGVGIQSLTTFIVGFIPFLIFIASFVNKKAYWQLSTIDYGCGALSLIGIILWIITKNPNMGIIFGILADFLAAIPTIIKSYHYPETENHWPFSLGVINPLIMLFTLTKLDLAHLGFPIYLLLANLVIFLLIKTKIGLRLKGLSL